MKRTLVPLYCSSRLLLIVMLIYDVIVVYLSHTYWIVGRLVLVNSLFTEITRVHQRNAPGR
jgi:hypothetical protein